MVLAALQWGCGSDRNLATPTEPSTFGSPLLPPNVAVGNWGGAGALLVVGGTQARLELPCAHASVPAPIALDSGGHFSVSAVLVPEKGPTLELPSADGLRVTLKGTVVLDAMSLEVVDQATQKSLMRFDLRAGSAVRIVKCA